MFIARRAMDGVFNLIAEEYQIKKGTSNIKKIYMSINQIITIFFDVDGIFTDGSLYILENGVKMTKFNVHDGMGCILLKEMGVDLLILTARHSDAIIERFKDLGINKIFTNILRKREFIKEYSKLII